MVVLLSRAVSTSRGKFEFRIVANPATGIVLGQDAPRTEWNLLGGVEVAAVVFVTLRSFLNVRSDVGSGN